MTYNWLTSSLGYVHPIHLFSSFIYLVIMPIGSLEFSFLCKVTILDSIQPQQMLTSTTDESENRANRQILLKAPHSLSQQCVCRNCGFCMFYRVYLSHPSHSASSYQHSDHHCQRSVGYTQSGHLSFSCFCFEKLEPDTG